MTFGSLFAGIGGFDLGLERAGMTCKWQVEIDPYCQAVLKKHWPHVARHDDIRTFTDAEPVDLICGGFPCQPFSFAGKRRGAADDRHLWPEMLRVIKTFRPTWVLGENVPGLVNMGLDQTLSGLEDAGYQTQTFDIPAVAVDAAHLRHRIWIVGHSKVGGKRPGLCTGEPATVGRTRSGDGSGYVADSISRGQPGSWQPFAPGDSTKAINREATQPVDGRRPSIWLPEPGLGRVAHGIPSRVDRLRALGNAIVPQVAEEIGRMIMRVEEEWR